MRNPIRLVLFISFILALIWAYEDQSLESVIAVFGILVGLLIEKREDSKKLKLQTSEKLPSSNLNIQRPANYFSTAREVSREIFYLLKSAKPRLTQDNEWNTIISRDNKKIVIGMISIKNIPGRKTDNSVAYNVSAHIDFFDRKNAHISSVKCGHWTKESPEQFFNNYGKSKRCNKITFYPHDIWYLPIVYKWEGEDISFAYDPTSSLKSKKLGNLPLKFRVFFEAENMKSARPLTYILVPQPAGLPDGFWIQQR